MRETLEFRAFKDGKMISIKSPEYCYCQRYEVRRSTFTLEILIRKFLLVVILNSSHLKTNIALAFSS